MWFNVFIERTAAGNQARAPQTALLARLPRHSNPPVKPKTDTPNRESILFRNTKFKPLKISQTKELNLWTSLEPMQFRCRHAFKVGAPSDVQRPGGFRVRD
jgi:hypothetical protein